MKCDMCGKEFETLNLFSQYGHNNPFKREECNKNTGYCDKCFLIKEKELDDMVYEGSEE